MERKSILACYGCFLFILSAAYILGMMICYVSEWDFQWVFNGSAFPFFVTYIIRFNTQVDWWLAEG